MEWNCESHADSVVLFDAVSRVVCGLYSITPIHCVTLSPGPSHHRVQAVFDVPESSVNPNIVFWVRCNPNSAYRPMCNGRCGRDQCPVRTAAGNESPTASHCFAAVQVARDGILCRPLTVHRLSLADASAPVTTGYGMPPDKKYDVYTTLSRDDFFYLYSGKAGPGAVSSMVLTGRIKVKWFKFDKLHSFASSFVYTTPQWIRYYTQYANTVNGFQIDADRLMASQWQKAIADRASDLVVDKRGEIVPAASIADAAVLEALRARGNELLSMLGAEGQPQAEEAVQVGAVAQNDVKAQDEAVSTEQQAGAALESPLPVLAENGDKQRGEVAEPVIESTGVADQPDLVPAQPLDAVPGAEPPRSEGQAADSDTSSASAAVVIASAAATSTVDTSGSNSSPPATTDEQQGMKNEAPVEPVHEQPEQSPSVVDQQVDVGQGEVAQAEQPQSDVAPATTADKAQQHTPALLASEQTAPDGSPLLPPLLSSSSPSSLALSEEATAVEHAQARLDMALMLPHIASQPDMTEKQLVEAGLQVVTLPSPLSYAPITSMRMMSVSQCAEPLLQSASSKQAEIVLLESSLTQVRGAIEYIQPGSELSTSLQASAAGSSSAPAAAPAASSISSSSGGFFDSALGYIGGALQGMGERMSGEAEKKEKRLQQLRREEELLLARREKLRRDSEGSLSKAEAALHSVYRAQAGGVALALLAANGYMGYTGSHAGDSHTATSSALASRLILRSVLFSSGRDGRNSAASGLLPGLPGLPAWVPSVLAERAARQASMHNGAHAPSTALAHVVGLFSLPEPQRVQPADGSGPAPMQAEAETVRQGLGQDTGVAPQAAPSLQAAIDLPPVSKQALQAVSQVWLAGEERALALDESLSKGPASSGSRSAGGHGSGPGASAGSKHGWHPEAAVERRLSGLRSLSSSGLSSDIRLDGVAPTALRHDSAPWTHGTHGGSGHAATGALGTVLGSIVDKLPSILETSRTEGVAPGQIDSLAGPVPVLPSGIHIHPERTPVPPSASQAPMGVGVDREEDSLFNGGAAVARHVAALTKSWQQAFPGCHPLASMATLVQRGVASITMRTLGRGMGPQGLASLGVHLPHAPLMWTPAGLPAFFPAWMTQPAVGQGKDTPLYVSTATSMLLSRLRPDPVPGGVWAMEPEHVETAAWCLGAGLHPFGKPPVCYDAIEHINKSGVESDEGSGMSLHPLWRPKRLMTCTQGGARKEKGQTSADSYSKGGSLSASALADAPSADQLRTVLSPWHLKSKSTLPTVYNGLGSEVYARTAGERLRLLYEDTIAATLRGAADAAAPAQRRRRSMSAVEAERLHWPDDTLQAARPPLGILDEVRAGKAVQDVVRKFRDMRILKVYAKSNPLSIYTADSEAELTRHAPGGSMSPVSPGGKGQDGNGSGREQSGNQS